VEEENPSNKILIESQVLLETEILGEEAGTMAAERHRCHREAHLARLDIF
jgi:hypothetical protein